MDNLKGAISIKVVLQLVFVVILVPFLPLLISRRWDWWEAWVYAVICVMGFFISRLLAARRHPDLLVERARFMQKESVESWDRFLSPLVGLGSGLIPLTAGLDKVLFRFAPFDWPLKVLSLLLILAGFCLGSYALIENRFFSGMVRIQFERVHRVVSTGPYRWMRHPGYAGALLVYLVTPVFLDSRWAFLPTIVISVTLIIRTALEDKTLQDKLQGYTEYARQVRYRLLPGVW